MINISTENGELKLWANCSDLFWWATADGEEITPDNFDILKQSIADCEKACKYHGSYGFNLFAARVRKLRPQDAAYPDEKALWPLFDAAGPERTVDPKAAFGNPFQRDAYWQKQQERKKTRLDNLNELANTASMFDKLLEHIIASCKSGEYDKINLDLIQSVRQKYEIEQKGRW